ncbi:uncharacterized protein EV422DRAFT_546325 [Fimicolochytrium jonesii]|uniref:uncharacterized protein n=1 Tax=Fimicolochytrium jonesii TaxID=1396493 RepID=UPI0022FDCE31|nr:uncharacterized protein EV422DRAFT_546325 [Fimicolochytrium jonesii]KAI8816334.1 hypothetical protein EV422DRAFT_546325 [Fimicolochytrium jonesii]
MIPAFYNKHKKQLQQHYHGERSSAYMRRGTRDGVSSIWNMWRPERKDSMVRVPPNILSISRGGGARNVKGAEYAMVRVVQQWDVLMESPLVFGPRQGARKPAKVAVGGERIVRRLRAKPHRQPCRRMLERVATPPASVAPHPWVRSRSKAVGLRRTLHNVVRSIVMRKGRCFSKVGDQTTVVYIGIMRSPSRGGRRGILWAQVKCTGNGIELHEDIFFAPHLISPCAPTYPCMVLYGVCLVGYVGQWLSNGCMMITSGSYTFETLRAGLCKCGMTEDREEDGYDGDDLAQIAEDFELADRLIPVYSDRSRNRFWLVTEHSGEFYSWCPPTWTMEKLGMGLENAIEAAIGGKLQAMEAKSDSTGR